MRIMVVILSLFIAGCTNENMVMVQKKFIEAHIELVAAQEELINVLEVKVKLLENKCTNGHEI